MMGFFRTFCSKRSEFPVVIGDNWPVVISGDNFFGDKESDNLGKGLNGSVGSLLLDSSLPMLGFEP